MSYVGMVAEVLLSADLDDIFPYRCIDYSHPPSTASMPAMTGTSPSHPHLIKVIKRPEPFASGSVSLVDLPAGAHFTNIQNTTPAARHYTTVQASNDMHVSLNSDLVYCNHSCAPTLVFDMRKLEVRVLDERPLRVGDALTFFYPSTEWEMDQPFECRCGAEGGRCMGTIKGAKFLQDEELTRYWLNEHIVEMLTRQITIGKESEY
jgi:hypothetical protein